MFPEEKPRSIHSWGLAADVPRQKALSGPISRITSKSGMLYVQDIQNDNMRITSIVDNMRIASIVDNIKAFRESDDPSLHRIADAISNELRLLP